MSFKAQRPIIVDIQEVENHPLYCSICCDIAIIDPMITPCNHIFCSNCITQGLQGNSICPNDRTSLSIDQLRSISGLLQHIYENLIVRCPKCAKWDGKLYQYMDHVSGLCSSSTYLQDLEHKLKTSNDEIVKLTEEQYHLHVVVNNLSRANIELNSNINAPDFDTSYRYDRNRVVELSQLICRYLEVKPNEIDRKRIFNCIELIHDDHIRGWVDNPPNFSLDVYMLLSICKASTWFTGNQLKRIMEWMQNSSW